MISNLLTAISAAAVCGALISGSALGQGATTAPGDIEALVKAARAEGELLYYIGVTENVAKRTSDAFFAKYGVRATFVRLPGAAGVRRYATEAEAGNIAADLLFTSGPAEAFAADSAKKGWVEPISQAGLPVLRGEYPQRFLLGHTAIVQVAPWIMAYNTERLKGSDIPKEWTDLLHPRFKGQLLLADPKAADAYLDQWNLFLDRYGESFLTRLKDQNMRVMQGAVPATNALAAGEGLVQFPGTSQQYQALIDKGAPLKMVTPDLTSGIELKVTVTHRAKAKHPNAARLFANYVLSQEGNKVFNADPGLYSVYDLGGLPKQYVSPKADATARKDLVLKLLGLQ